MTLWTDSKELHSTSDDKIGPKEEEDDLLINEKKSIVMGIIAYDSWAALIYQLINANDM